MLSEGDTGVNIMTTIDNSRPGAAMGEGLPSPVRLGGEGARTVRAGFIPLVDAAVLIAAGALIAGGVLLLRARARRTAK